LRWKHCARTPRFAAWSKGLLSTLLAGFLILGCLDAHAEEGGNIEIQGLLTQLWSYANLDASARSGRTVTFDFSEDLINAYVKTLILTGNRRGASSASVSFQGDGGVALALTVDLAQLKEWDEALCEAASKAKSPTIQVVFRFKRQEGRPAVYLASVSKTKDGLSPELAKSVLQVVASHQPEHFNLGAPIVVPFGLRTVRVSPRSIYASTRAE
jgi:hypothetical protein